MSVLVVRVNVIKKNFNIKVIIEKSKNKIDNLKITCLNLDRYFSDAIKFYLL